MVIWFISAPISSSAASESSKGPGIQQVTDQPCRTIFQMQARLTQGWSRRTSGFLNPNWTSKINKGCSSCFVHNSYLKPSTLKGKRQNPTAQDYAYFRAKIEASRVHRGVLPFWSWKVPSGRLDLTDGYKDQGGKKVPEGVLWEQQAQTSKGIKR